MPNKRDRTAYHKIYWQRPEVKAKDRARTQTPERRAYTRTH